MPAKRPPSAPSDRPEPATGPDGLPVRTAAPPPGPGGIELPPSERRRAEADDETFATLETSGHALSLLQLVPLSPAGAEAPTRETAQAPSASLLTPSLSPMPADATPDLTSTSQAGAPADPVEAQALLAGFAPQLAIESSSHGTPAQGAGENASTPSTETAVLASASDAVGRLPQPAAVLQVVGSAPPAFGGLTSGKRPPDLPETILSGAPARSEPFDPPATKGVDSPTGQADAFAAALAPTGEPHAGADKGAGEAPAVPPFGPPEREGLAPGLTFFQGGSTAAPIGDPSPAGAAEPSAALPLVQNAPLAAVPVEIGVKLLAGVNRFEIRLDPEELGRVEVRLEIDEEGGVKAQLVVDRVETLGLLQRDAKTLERAFEQAGLRPSEGGIDLSLRNPQSDARGQDRQEGRPGHGAVPAKTAPEAAEAETPARIVRGLWASSQRLDLRI